MGGRDKTIIETLFIVGSSMSRLCVPFRSGFVPNVVKSARGAFTAEHGEPIRDQSPRRPVHPFTTVDTEVRPGFNGPPRVCWRDGAHARRQRWQTPDYKKKNKNKVYQDLTEWLPLVQVHCAFIKMWLQFHL